MSRNPRPIRYFLGLLACFATLAVVTPQGFAKTTKSKTTSKTSSKTSTKTITSKKGAPKRVVRHRTVAKKTTTKKAVLKTTAYEPAPARVTRKVVAKKVVSRGHWTSPNFINGDFDDVVAGDDPVARNAAVTALGRLNGTVVVTDGDTGRILTVVNQKTAYKSGYQPCSTIKIPVALAALSEGVVDRLTQIRIYGNTKVAMTEALAKSSNQYFASLGEKLGFDRVSYYARLFGLGEKASLNIAEEQPGILPVKTPASGMGMMTSFGDGITLTPLEYAALIGAVSNGGTLYYLQYPKSPQEASVFEPKIKRKLAIENLVGEIRPGMMGAVEYGTARRIGPREDLPIWGKTGTCTDTRTPTHLGWFGSFTEIGHDHVVVVVLLTAGSAASGGSAAGVAGQVYRNLVSQDFYSHRDQASPVENKVPVTLDDFIPGPSARVSPLPPPFWVARGTGAGQ